MKNFADSDYALNKYSNGTVYRFADSIVEVTLTDYLAENPTKTEADFYALKKLSDADYPERDRAENTQTKKNAPYDAFDEADLQHSQTPEALIIGELDEIEETTHREQRRDIANDALSKLTDVQRQRYLMYHANGMTTRAIAAEHGVTHQSVVETLAAAEKKIKKFLTNP